MHGFLPLFLPEAAPRLARARRPLSLIKQTAEGLQLLLINVNIRSIARVMGGLLVACALQAQAQAAEPALSSAAVCAGNGVLKDFFGRPLPGSPAMRCAGGATAPGSAGRRPGLASVRLRNGTVSDHEFWRYSARMQQADAGLYFVFHHQSCGYATERVRHLWLSRRAELYPGLRCIPLHCRDLQSGLRQRLS